MGRMITVLCIDDEPTGLLVRKMLLEHAGYRVLTASSGREGLRVFANETVDLVVLDFTMPEMNGGEVARELRSLSNTVPIIFLSAHLTLPTEALRFSNASLTKGDPPGVLLEQIARALSPGSAMHS